MTSVVDDVPPPAIITDDTTESTTTGTSSSHLALPAASPSPHTKTLKGELKRLIGAYHNSLVSRPLATKAVTSALISALGDVLASSGRAGRGRNGKRTLGFLLFGGLITGPVCHYWYGFLERHVKTFHGAKNVAIKVLLDKLLFTPPFLALTLFLLRALETGRFGPAWQGMKHIYVPTLKTNLKVWTVAQAINFTYTPPAYRVLFGNVVALWWSFYLSRLGGGAGGGAGKASSIVIVRRSY
ncbi:hypothetical protein VYU27_003641 [Nannochloropsis oceanica]